MRWRRGLARKGTEGQVVGEAARLLAGTTYDANYDNGRYVPPWTVVAALAHCDRRRLGELRDLPPTALAQSWRATLAYLATELAARAGTDAELRRLQHDVLVPLELELLDRGRGWMATPAKLIDLLSGELATYERRGGR